MITLAEYIIQKQHEHPKTTGELQALDKRIKSIARDING